MSGINRAGDKPIGTEPSSKRDKKKDKPSVNLVEQGITSSKNKKAHPVKRPKGGPEPSKTLDTKKTLKIVKDKKAHRVSQTKENTASKKKESKVKPPKERPLVSQQEKDETLQLVFEKLIPYYEGHRPIPLLEEIHQGLSTFNQQEHTFQARDHIVHVSKTLPAGAIKISTVAIGSKTYFGFGAFGKIYGVSDSDMVLKLSRKKLKDIDDKTREKIPLTAKERTERLAKGTELGTLAREEIEKEIRVMTYIRQHAESLTGLNVELFGKVTFNLQTGYFTKRYQSDGFDFTFTNPPAETRFEIMVDLALGLLTLHELNFVHRDIKLENTLVKKNGRQITLVDGTLIDSYDAALTDFGNADSTEAIFRKVTYPTLDDILENGTPCYVADRFVAEIKKALESIKNWKPETPEYQAHVNFIRARLEDIDQTALGLSLYILWVDKMPPFQTFKDDVYFDLDKGSNLYSVMDEMKKEIYSASHTVSGQKIGNEYALADQIIDWIQKGLELELREVNLLKLPERGDSKVKGSEQK